LLSALWSVDPGNSLNKSVRFLSVTVFACYVANRYSLVQFVRLFTRGFAIAIVLSLLVMVLVPKLGHSNLGGGYENAWRGAFIHKNWLGAAMSLGLLMTGYSYLIRANSRMLSGVSFFGCLMLLVLSMSASAMVSTLVASVAVVLGAAIQNRSSPVLRTLAMMAIGLGIAVLILLPIIFTIVDLSHLLTVIGRSSTLTGRTEVWQAMLGAIREKPLVGYGYGFWDQASMTRSNIWLEVGWKPPHAHNTWLDAALQLGLIGVALTAAVWLIPLRRCLVIIVSRFGQGAPFFLAILLSLLVRSAFETVMFTPALNALFWLITSYVYVSVIMRQRAAAGTAAPNALSPVSTCTSAYLPA
jgi:O-antigen ligase